jgi:hypothetical protein
MLCLVNLKKFISRHKEYFMDVYRVQWGVTIGKILAFFFLFQSILIRLRGVFFGTKLRIFEECVDPPLPPPWKVPHQDY